MPNFLFPPYILNPTSIEPTLHNTHPLFLNKTLHYFPHYKPPQIILLHPQDRTTHYVKPLIALPPHKIQIKNHQL
ncbi:S26 family signal peptidase, partial [Bacillus altitudinis]|uniref:S26 family signal peptidase n=1 Tax=Bacillus altitudinis TaxID=293387 RepID=UPI002357013A